MERGALFTEGHSSEMLHKQKFYNDIHLELGGFGGTGRWTDERGKQANQF